MVKKERSSRRMSSKNVIARVQLTDGVLKAIHRGHRGALDFQDHITFTQPITSARAATLDIGDNHALVVFKLNCLTSSLVTASKVRP